MKYLIFASISFLMMSSCKKNNPLPIDDQPFDENVFSIKKNGVVMSFHFISGIRMEENGQYYILIQASTDEASSEVLSVVVPVATGDYNIMNPDDGHPSVIHLFTNSVESGYSVSGALKVTSHNETTKRIKGTLNFTTAPLHNEGVGYEFTAGSFDVQYIQ